MKKFEKVGSGSYGVYKEKKESVWPTIFGFAFIVVILSAIFG